MSTTAEDLRKIMNLAPFANPFSETFDPAFHSLEAIRNAINGIESGIYTYCSKSGSETVEIDDGGEYSIELLNPGDVIIPLASINPGNYKIDRIRDNAETNIVPLAGASRADGRIYCTHQFTTAVGWATGDLFKITFTGGSVTIGGVSTAFPDSYFYGRVVISESNALIEFTAQPAQPVSGVLNADPTEIEDIGSAAATVYGDAAAVVKSYVISPGMSGITKYAYVDLTHKVSGGVNPKSKWMVCAGDSFVFTGAVPLTDELSGAGTFHRSGQLKLAAMDNVPFTIALLCIVDSGTATVSVTSTTELRIALKPS